MVVCFFRFPPAVFRLTRTSSLGGEREVGAAVAVAFFFALFFLSEGSTVMADSRTSSFPSRVRHSTLKWVQDDYDMRGQVMAQTVVPFFLAYRQDRPY